MRTFDSSFVIEWAEPIDAPLEFCNPGNYGLPPRNWDVVLLLHDGILLLTYNVDAGFAKDAGVVVAGPLNVERAIIGVIVSFPAILREALKQGSVANIDTMFKVP